MSPERPKLGCFWLCPINGPLAPSLVLYSSDKTRVVIRIPKAVGALAIAGDCATGRPRGARLSGSVIATGLAQSFGLDEQACQAAYYASLFRFMGCTASDPEADSMALGNDRGSSLAFLLCDWFDLSALEVSLKA